MSSTDRRFICWNAVQLALKRAGVPNHGSVATLLLETFLEDNYRLPASKAGARGLCKEGEFWLWRKMLVEKGWLQWSEAQQDKGQYFPGKKLMRYINKEILAQKEIATRESVDQVRAEKADRSELHETKLALADTKAELEKTKKAVAEIAEAVRELQEASIPPDSPQKKLTREKAMAKIALRAVSN